MSFEPGSNIGPYEIVESIGRGGMGEVYRACDPRLGRDVALKVLPAGTAADAERLERFEREARATAVLNHRNILTVHDIGRHQGAPYVVYELLEGETLRERLESAAPLSPRDAVELTLQLVRGIAAAHALRIVHRDLKPENIMITPDGSLKVLDFGLAKLIPPPGEPHTSGEVTLTATAPGRLLGTVGYMAPEQVRGEPADARADLFAIGIVLHEMLGGTPPFQRRSSAETLAAILHEDPPPLSRADLPPRLERLLRQCLEKDPGDRVQSARDLGFALESVLAEVEGPAPVPRPSDPAGESSIAVLPFADMSPGQDQAYFCHGIAEELLNALSRVQGLRVAARSSSFQFQDPGVDLRAVGERLGVGGVLEGSVRKSGDRLRVSVQLVEVATGYQTWSDRYDRSLEDVFAIQDEIATSVVRSLRGVLAGESGPSVPPAGATAIEAYEHFLRGREQVHQFRRPSFDLAIRMFERALDVDPGYAPAWAGLANVHSWLYQWWGGAEENLREAERASRRALELAPDSPDAQAARGFMLSLDGRYEEAGKEFEAAIRLDPEHFDAHYLYGRTVFAKGDVEASVRLFRRASEIRRDDHQTPVFLAQSLSVLGRKDEAREADREAVRRAERRLELEPADARALSLGAQSLYKLGDRERASSWISKAVDLYPDEAGVLINAGCLFAKMGDKERALEALEKAFARGQGKRDWIEHDPDYDLLRDDPRFQALLEKMP